MQSHSKLDAKEDVASLQKELKRIEEQYAEQRPHQAHFLYRLFFNDPISASLDQLSKDKQEIEDKLFAAEYAAKELHAKKHRMIEKQCAFAQQKNYPLGRLVMLRNQAKNHGLPEITDHLSQQIQDACQLELAGFEPKSPKR